MLQSVQASRVLVLQAVKEVQIGGPRYQGREKVMALVLRRLFGVGGGASLHGLVCSTTKNA